MKLPSKIYWADGMRRTPVCRCAGIVCMLLSTLSGLAAEPKAQPAKPVIIESRKELETAHYRITIIERREECVVDGAEATYTGVNKKTGKSITLKGTDVHTLTPSGAPGCLLGYQFKNGKTEYFVSEDGELEVTRGSKTLVKEQGKWKE